MKKKYLLFLPIVSLLAAGISPSSAARPWTDLGDDGYYASFMYNYPRMYVTSNSGLQIRGENLLYRQVEITLGQKLTAPEDPEREKYEFQGWYKEQKCLTAWNFESDIAENSVILYAKWGVSESEEYVEPEYVVPETIITDADYRVTGILNKEVVNGQVNLSTGAIKRLENSPLDVKFAVNYERSADTELTLATYNSDTKNIHLETNKGQTFDIRVNDISSSLVISNSAYEAKAKNYEEKDADFENYHIVLGGSSSMENWSTSKEDMNPIVTTNHGIGGTTVNQWVDSLFERLVLPYSPKAVVYYVGVNNIINSGDNGTTTGNLLMNLFDKTHRYLPNTKIFYVLINKLPYYAHCQADFDIANNMAKNYEKSHSYLTCIDAGQGLLKDNGKPNFGYFKPDGLHMSKYGYVIWGGAVKQAIIDWLG